ncbi:MAG TPA: pyroglutamyl-peptidase I [Xanthobacteraceae bacterium]|jgi:pyroglutamyl-peptidase|nr:pyroglutamyl-peptidase I [Xanthobacteraceae bacterium]
MPLTVLITGFGPFPGAPFNPTAALARRLAGRRRPAFADVSRIAHVFQTSYAAVERELPTLIKRVRPDVVLLFGVATRTKYLRIETRARNARSPLFPDADGNRPGASIIDLGKAATRSGRAPQQALLAAIRAERLPVRLSHSAGRYLCNFAYWHALAATDGGNAPLVQFIHVPTVRRGPMRPADRRRLTPADLQRAGEAILTTLLVAARNGRYRRAPALAVVSVEVQRQPKPERRQALAG